MDVNTGETFTREEFESLIIALENEGTEESKSFTIGLNKNGKKSRPDLMRLPHDITEDSVHKLQKKELSAGERRSIINKLHKRRKKNKLASKSRKKNKKK